MVQRVLEPLNDKICETKKLSEFIYLLFNITKFYSIAWSIYIKLFKWFLLKYSHLLFLFRKCSIILLFA